MHHVKAKNDPIDDLRHPKQGYTHEKNSRSCPRLHAAIIHFVVGSCPKDLIDG